MHMSTPIKSRGGDVMAVLAAHVDLSEMSEIMLQRSGLSTSEHTYLVNAFNFFVTDPRHGAGYALKRAVHTDGVSACLRGEDGVGLYDDDRGVPVIGAYQWIPEREMCILTEVDQAEAFAPVVALRRTVIGLGVAFTVFVALAGVFFASTITKPVRELVQGTEEMRRGNLEHRVAVRSRDEIGQLATAFNETAANLERSQGELVRQAAALREANERLQYLVSSSPAVIYTSRPHGDYGATFISENVSALLGYQAREFIEDAAFWANRIHPEDAPRVMAGLAHLFDQGRHAHEYRFLHQDGTYRWMRDEMKLVLDAGGNPLETIGYWIDITERKQAEEALQRRVLELSALNSIATIVKESLGVTEILKRAMDQALRLVGVEAGAMFLLDEEAGELAMAAHRGISDEFVQAASPFKLGEGMTGKAAQTGEPVVMPDLSQYPGALKGYIDGERIRSAAVVPLLGTSGVIGTMNLAAGSPDCFDADGVQLLVSLGRQVAIGVEKARLYAETRARAAELEAAYGQLRQAQERLIRQERLAVLGQLAGGVGHELRNPLGAIKNAAYFLNMVLEDPDPEVKETLEILDREVNTSEGIISSLLDFARPKPRVPRKVDLKAVLQDVLKRAEAPDTVGVKLRWAEDMPLIYADPDQLGQVFDNLIGNAIQAMPEGGTLTVAGELASEAEAADNLQWVVVSVADTGVGISEENMAKLFEPLFTTKAKGIGLGLAVSKMLVEGHGGTVGVASQVGEGTTFTVRLPVGV